LAADNIFRLSFWWFSTRGRWRSRDGSVHWPDKSHGAHRRRRKSVCRFYPPGGAGVSHVSDCM